MTRTAHKGIKIKAVALKGRDFGRCRLTVGDWTCVTDGNEAFNVGWAIRTIDASEERPDAYEPHWIPASHG